MPKKSVEPVEESVLKSAAKVIGKAAGKVAALAHVDALGHAPAPSAPKPKAKLAKKNNPHLPRRMKKAQKKLSLAS